MRREQKSKSLHRSGGCRRGLHPSRVKTTTLTALREHQMPWALNMVAMRVKTRQHFVKRNTNILKKKKKTQQHFREMKTTIPKTQHHDILEKRHNVWKTDFWNVWLRPTLSMRVQHARIGHLSNSYWKQKRREHFTRVAANCCQLLKLPFAC